MTVASADAAQSAGERGWLSKSATVAGAGYNRWLVPPAALAIHLCIGMAYGFSVFLLPLGRAIGISKAVDCATDATILNALFTTTCDWRQADLGWTYSLFFVFLGCSAAIWGGWLERVGPRLVGMCSAALWSGGLLIAALGIYVHQLWLMWLGAGVIGGIGLGLGYISPVSTLVKWFPDRRGMATGMAIMGFGGGAVVGSPIANQLITMFKSPTQVGVWQAFVVMALIYFVFMMIGALSYRIPPAGWRPEGWTPPPETASSMITQHNVHLNDAHKTPQFWLIWAVLCLNVTAGIGIIGAASPMLQETFGGKLIGHPDVGFAQFTDAFKTQAANFGGVFVGLFSLFNIAGRFFWSSLSDIIGRKLTYYIFFCIIATMYGGGFATIPAYLADMFGTQFVGAIHGRLLTAWSTAGVFGPLIVNYIHDARKAAGVPPEHIYDFTLYILAALLAAGFLCNLLITPVAAKWHMSESDMADARSKSGTAAATRSFGIGRGGLDLETALAWAVVLVPIGYGVYVAITKLGVLFQ